VRIELNADWNDFLRLLLSHHVRFLLVGGHAVAGHGEPRLTEDLDVYVDVSAANARRLRKVLVEFGLGSATPSESELLERGRIWMIGRKPHRIDILTEIDGVAFEECWLGRTEADFAPAPIPVIGRTELIKNKRASGREKDRADVERLEQFRDILPKKKTKTKATTRKKSRGGA